MPIFEVSFVKETHFLVKADSIELLRAAAVGAVFDGWLDDGYESWEFDGAYKVSDAEDAPDCDNVVHEGAIINKIDLPPKP